MAMTWIVANLSSASSRLANEELALKNQLKGLDSLWSSADHWLSFWTAVVVVGVVVELVVILVEHFHAKKELKLCEMRPAVKPGIKILVFELLGAGLVALGVGMEFRTHIQTGKIETDMRNITGQLVGIADEKAGDAIERAAKSEREAAADKLETEKIKKVVAWRIISPDMATELEKILKAKPGSVNLRYTDGDPEALFFAIQVSQILGKAHWNVAPGAEKFANAIQFGIALPDSPGDDIQTLRAAFVAAKIPFSTNPLPREGSEFSVTIISGAPTLMIGSRPPPQIK